MRKRGQVSETFLYILAGVITAVVVYYGVSAIMEFRGKGAEAESILLKEKITLDVQRISKQLGAARNFSYLFPSEYNEVCYVDTSKGEEIINNLSISAIISDSVEANSTNNVFLFGQKTDAFRAGDIQVCESPVACFQTQAGVARVEMYGGGGFALLEPCPAEINRPPVVVNETPAYVTRNVSSCSDFEVNINNIALATDPDKDNMDIDWYLLKWRNTTKTRTDTNATSPAEANYNLKVQNSCGVYRLVVVATDYAGKAGSGRFEFIINIQVPENNNPYAEILNKGINYFNVGQPITLNGLGNDTEKGTLSYKWDFGDGTSEEGSVWFDPAAQNNFTNITTHTYNAVGNYSVWFTVTDEQGAWATDNWTVKIGNTPPVITPIEPVNGANLSTRDVNLTFNVWDREQEKTNCVIDLLSQTEGLRTIAIGDVANNTDKSWSLSNLQEGNYTWTVSCSDGLLIATSNPMNFTILLPILPVLNCYILSSCGSLFPVISLSDLTNAHAEVPGGNYPKKVCCNLTEGILTSSGATVLKLSDAQNAHAEDMTHTNYGTAVQMGTSDPKYGTIACRTAGSCDPGQNETCVVSLSDYTNAHVADCSGYSIKICCRDIPSP